MAFKKKTWTDRVAEFINRRTLTKEDGSTELVTVARSEGTISKEGDAFNAETMNDLEQRIEDGIESLNEDLAKLNANLSEKSKVTIQAQTLMGNGSNWILASNSGKKLIAAQTVRDDTRFFVEGINKQSATGLYTLIFNETIEENSKILVWLTWVD